MNLYKIIYLNNNKITIFDNNNILSKQVSPKIFNKGVIINYRLFLNELSTLLKYNLLNSIFNNKKTIFIYNDYISINDLNIIKNILNELNIYKYKIITDTSLLNIKHNECSLIIDDSYIRLYYYDKYNTKNKLIIDLKELTFFEIKYLLFNRIKNKITYIYGHNEKLEKILRSLKVKYYIYNDENFLINSFLLNTR